LKRKKKERLFDSVGGVFVEGKELYPSAGFREKNHIQLCIRNPNCIKGYFHLQEISPGYPIPLSTACFGDTVEIKILGVENTPLRRQ
jgi:hypothetical protein